MENGLWGDGVSIGSFICLGLIAAQLVDQVAGVIRGFRRSPRPPVCPPIARRDFLDRRAEIERDARRRL